jgi:protein adenylyltransferase
LKWQDSFTHSITGDKVLADLELPNSSNDEANDLVAQSRIDREVLGALHSRVCPSVPHGGDSEFAYICSDLCTQLGITTEDIATRLDVFSGDASAMKREGMHPWAYRYAGHQFGSFVRQLGDGRAASLAQVCTQHENYSMNVNTVLGQWFRDRSLVSEHEKLTVRPGQCTPSKHIELQLKGSGRTPYSRRFDGRAVVRSSVRELLMSEAMYHLGVPTTRALCLVGTNAPVIREAVEPAAVLCRTSPSWIRFGSFEAPYYSEEHRGPGSPPEILEQLTNYAIETHFPFASELVVSELATSVEESMLMHVMHRTAKLVAAWSSLGFVHGVMNTDNFSVLGLTLDYGPYGFVSGYNPLYSPNKTDAGGLYALGRQLDVAEFVYSAFVQTIAPVSTDRRKHLIGQFSGIISEYYYGLMCAKLGLVSSTRLLSTTTESTSTPSARTIVDKLLALMRIGHLDYTITMRHFVPQLITLAQDTQGTDLVPALFSDVVHEIVDIASTSTSPDDISHLCADMQQWCVEYAREFESNAAQSHSYDEARETALDLNPAFILRNSIAQRVIDDLGYNVDKNLPAHKLDEQHHSAGAAMKQTMSSIQAPYQSEHPEAMLHPDEQIDATPLSCSS